MIHKIKKLFQKERTAQRPWCAAVVPAAGSAARMEGTDKVLAELGGIPVLVRALQPLEASPLIDEIVVVTREDLIVRVGELCQAFGLSKVRKVIVGGPTRARSVLLGLSEVSRQTGLAAIHDGARPFLSQQVLEDVIAAGNACGAAAPAVPVNDTIKAAENGVVTATPDRSTLFAVQTPQVFEAGLIRGALEQAIREGAELTDDCSAVERIGVPVHLTPGARENIKITTPVDLALGEAILAWRQD